MRNTKPAIHHGASTSTRWWARVPAPRASDAGLVTVEGHVYAVDERVDLGEAARIREERVHRGGGYGQGGFALNGVSRRATVYPVDRK